MENGYEIGFGRLLYPIKKGILRVYAVILNIAVDPGKWWVSLLLPLYSLQ